MLHSLNKFLSHCCCGAPLILLKAVRSLVGARHMSGRVAVAARYPRPPGEAQLTVYGTSCRQHRRIWRSVSAACHITNFVLLASFEPLPNKPTSLKQLL